jgi:hypothetical protein
LHIQISWISVLPSKRELDMRTWKIRSWNCETQTLEPEREVTLEQYLAEVKAASARAKAIHAANVAAS